LNKKILILFPISCALTLLACSSNNHSTLFTPVSTDTDSATVYIYRPAVMTNAIYSPDLLINGEEKFSLKIGRKYLLTLPPGDTAFEIEPDKNYSGITRLKLSLKPDRRYYLRIDTTLKINSSTTYEAYQRGFSLVEIDEKSAIAEISECCSKRRKNIIEHTEAKSTSDKKNSSSSFSVDKTQNPFSH